MYTYGIHISQEKNLRKLQLLGFTFLVVSIVIDLQGMFVYHFKFWRNFFFLKLLFSGQKFYFSLLKLCSLSGEGAIPTAPWWRWGEGHYDRLEISSEGLQHKVHIYKEYHSVCPLVGIGTLPPPLSPATVALPPETKMVRGGHTRLRVRGWGSPNPDDWRKAWHSAYSVVSTIHKRGNRKIYCEKSMDRPYHLSIFLSFSVSACCYRLLPT